MHESEIGHFDSDLGGGLSPARDALMRIEIGRLPQGTGTALVVRVAGEIDLFTAGRLRTALATGFEDLRHGEILVIDLTEVTFLASHGLEILVDATDTAQQRDKLLRIVVGHSRSVIRPIQLTGLADVLALFNTVEDAVRAPT